MAMTVGVGCMTFALYDIHSLKQKRSIVKSIVHRIKNTFNISIAEVDCNDHLAVAVIGFTVTGNDTRVVNSILDKVLNMADDLRLAQLADHWIDIIHFGSSE